MWCRRSVTVKASLLDKKGFALASGDSFDKISHILLPKQVSPFRIDFEGLRLSQVDSVRTPSASLVPASADPVIGIESQKLNPVPDARSRASWSTRADSGQRRRRWRFYDASGQIVWVADQYPDRALPPEGPVPFRISLPADVSSRVGSYRVVASTYVASRFQ